MPVAVVMSAKAVVHPPAEVTWPPAVTRGACVGPGAVSRVRSADAV